MESYRYEYTGAYGSPELDRAAVKVEKVEVSADGKSVELTTAPLVKDRVYLLTANVRSAIGGDAGPPDRGVHAERDSGEVTTSWPAL